MPNDLIGLLGGTFDPIHNGHLQLSQQAYQTLGLKHLEFIPNSKPVNRKPPQASNQDRLAMLACALNPYPFFHINPIEIQRGGTSYTIDSLIELSKQRPHQTLCLLIGSDNLLTLNQWKNWQQLFEYAHLIVINRPHHSLSDAPWLNELINNRQTTDLSDLHIHKAGSLYFLAMNPNSLSASNIRAKIANSQPLNEQLPINVIDYIQAHQLYRQTS